MSSCVDAVALWMRSNRLQLNAAKTQVLWCASSRGQHRVPQDRVQVGKDLIIPATSVRILGVYFDSDISMRTHVTRGAKLVLITNRKSHMSFRLVPNSMTLDDLERRNSPNRSDISPNSVVFGTDYVKVVKIHRYFLQRKCRPKNLVFNYISLMAILAGDHPSESVKVSHSPLASENLTNN